MAAMGVAGGGYGKSRWRLREERVAAAPGSPGDLVPEIAGYCICVIVLNLL